MRLSNLWRRRKKTAVEPFAPAAEDTEDEGVVESEPASPRQPGEGQGSKARPHTTDDEVRPRSSPRENAAAIAELKDEASPSIGAPQTSTPSSTPPAAETAADAPPLVDFSLPLVEVISKVEEAFGQTTAHNLQSSKWDKRVQGLKNIGTVLKGLELGSAAGKPSAMKGLRLRDRALCWRTSCQVLHHSIRDKVIPVRLASHELFCDTFASVAGVTNNEEILFANGVLLGHLVERLGDSNLRLHEGARKGVVACAQPHLMGVKGVLSRLQGHLETTARRNRERCFGVLDTVATLVRNFPQGDGATPKGAVADGAASPAAKSGAAWEPEDIWPFITIGMDDASGPRARTCAVTLAVSLRSSFGDEAVEPVMSGLRPGVAAVLRERFAEVDDEEDFIPPCPTTLAGLVICGSALRPSTGQTQPSMPGAVADDDEEFLDKILEDAGMVFGGNSSALGAAVASATPSCLDGLDPDFFDMDTEPERQRSEKGRPGTPSVRFNMAVEVF